MFDSKRWVDAVVSRSDLLTEEAVVFGDKELCYREAYPDRGGYLVKEGNVDDAFENGFYKNVINLSS